MKCLYLAVWLCGSLTGCKDLLDVAWAAVSLAMCIPVRPKEVPIAMLISPLSAEAAPVKVDRRCREGLVGRKEPSLHYRGLSSFVRKMMYETASPLDSKENTTERADARENTVPVMETDGLVLSPGYCQGSRWKWALRMKDLIQLAAAVCWARCPDRWPSIHSHCK